VAHPAGKGRQLKRKALLGYAAVTLVVAAAGAGALVLGTRTGQAVSSQAIAAPGAKGNDVSSGGPETLLYRTLNEVSNKRIDSAMSEIAWIKEDYAAALQQADADGKLIMIDVYTEWCGPCKLMDKKTFPEKEVVDKSANFVSLKLDAEKGQGVEVAKKFGVTSFPTMLFVNGKGELVHSVEAYQTPEALVAEMDKALDKV